MSVRRREVLATFGVASASTLLWALGCGAPTTSVRRTPQVSGEVRTWLRDAVARLAMIYPSVHALAVSRRRTVAAHDVLGAGVARLRSDGVVFTVHDRDGARREHAISELSAAAIDAAATALGASRARKPLDFGPAPAAPAEPVAIDERDLRHRVARLLDADAALAHRIVYAAALLDIDDAIVWSIAPGRDLEQRLVRHRQLVTRAAWNGTRPVVRDLERVWSGALDDHTLTADEIAATSEATLEQMTPGAFDDGPRTVVLDPSVVAILVDTLTRTLLTSRAAQHPAIARRFPAGAALASPAFTLIDDPTSAGAYGGFAFDDEGQPAAPLTLLDAGHVASRLGALDNGATGHPDPASDAAVRDRRPDGATSRGLVPNVDNSATNGATSRGLVDNGAAGVGRRPGVADGATSRGLVTNLDHGATGRGRRPGHLGCVEPASTHLVVSPGSVSASELYIDGFLLEAGLSASLDPVADRLSIACGRARELKAGSPTGRLYPDVELVGSITALLGAIDAIARDPVTFSLRAPSASAIPSLLAPAPSPSTSVLDLLAAPRWASIATPALRTRGLVRARRSRP